MGQAEEVHLEIRQVLSRIVGFRPISGELRLVAVAPAILNAGHGAMHLLMLDPKGSVANLFAAYAHRRLAERQGFEVTAMIDSASLAEIELAVAEAIGGRKVSLICHFEAVLPGTPREIDSLLQKAAAANDSRY
jgi:hypothetical protein